MVSGKGNISRGKGSNTSLKTTKIKRERISENEGSDDETTLPNIRNLESMKALPRFMSVVNRTDDNGVLIEELDSLQMELEMLLNSVVLRSLELQKEVASMTEKPSSPGKKSKLDEKSPKKSKDLTGKLKEASTQMVQLNKQLKIKTVPPKPATTEGVVEEIFPVEIAKASTSKNDIPNKFWQSVEPYCAPFTEDDLQLLDDLIVAHNEDEEYFKIPPLGRHYTLRWAEDDLHHEQREGARFGDKKKGAAPGFSEDAQRLVDGTVAKTSNETASGTALCGPVTQRLISALLEENIVTSSDDMMPIDGHDENAQTGVKTAFTGPQAVALERRIRQELEEQGLFSLDDGSCAPQQEDEILKELKRCQGELRAISQHNVQQLKRLQRLAQEEMKRQETRKKLQNFDSEVLDVYRKVMLAKQKKRPLTKKEKESAWKALRDREALVKHLDT